MLETSPALSATPVMALAKTAKQQKRDAADRETREEEDFFVPSISEKASASSHSSSSDRASLSDEERYHHRPSRRRKQARPRPTTESKSSRFKTPVSAASATALPKTATRQQPSLAGENRGRNVPVNALSDIASVSPSSASDRASDSDERRRKRARPRPTTESKSSRFQTPVSAASVTALPKTATRQQPSSAGETRGRNVPVNAVSDIASRAKTRTIAKTSSASTAHGQRKPTRRVGTFSAHSEGSANQDPKFLLFKGNGRQCFALHTNLCRHSRRLYTVRPRIRVACPHMRKVDALSQIDIKKGCNTNYHVAYSEAISVTIACRLFSELHFDR
ncbi:unnamed protein product [Dibothriocephalus latus]|uniref:Uncharacterized protein n=1 Tax=Dibothriocephalus latus TaxID=60516 RepID=A0A3P7LW38_DIBLA|nr:unnamed protein product [Dibothriocephalus latus]